MSQRTCLCSVSSSVFHAISFIRDKRLLQILGWAPAWMRTGMCAWPSKERDWPLFQKFLSSSKETIMTTHLQKTHSPISLCWDGGMHLSTSESIRQPVIRSYYHCRLLHSPGPGAGVLRGRAEKHGGRRMKGWEGGGRGLASPRLTGLEERKWKHLDEVYSRTATCPPCHPLCHCSSIHPSIPWYWLYTWKTLHVRYTDR